METIQIYVKNSPESFEFYSYLPLPLVQDFSSKLEEMLLSDKSFLFNISCNLYGFL
jgi:hypothetical protein